MNFDCVVSVATTWPEQILAVVQSPGSFHFFVRDELCNAATDALVLDTGTVTRPVARPLPSAPTSHVTSPLLLRRSPHRSLAHDPGQSTSHIATRRQRRDEYLR